jgi:4-amino-4-deoxy-L-arabinose transferase-like glycosyltransferase
VNDERHGISNVGIEGSMSEREDESAPADHPDAEFAIAANDQTGSAPWVRVAVSVAIAVLVLVHAQGVGLDALHLIGVDHTFNDQVIYVDAARHLVATNELTTGAIYPSTLRQEYGRNFFYMPGHAMLIALSFALVGDAAWTAMLPNLIAYGVCLLCLYATGRRLDGSRAGWYAAVAFAFTPIFLVYAFSAMAEMTTLATGLLAFTIFVHLPRRARHWAVPVLLLGPFLFRETAAFWITPMIVLLLTDAESTRVERWRAAVIALASSVLALGAVYRLDWIADRPSLFAQNLFGKTYGDKYTDAFSTAHVEMNPGTLAAAVLDLAARNLGDLFRLLTTQSYESLTLHVLLWLPVGAAALAWSTPRLRSMVGAWALFSVTTVVFLTLLYRWNFFIGVRQLLPPMLLGLVILGAAVAERTRVWSQRSCAIAACALWLLSLATVVYQTGLVTAFDDKQEIYRKILESTSVPEKGLLVARDDLGLIYLHDNPLRRFALSPFNLKTLELLESRYDVRAALSRQPLTRIGLDATGLRRRGSISVFHYYEEPESPEPGGRIGGP